jgi:hypothetical protein
VGQGVVYQDDENRPEVTIDYIKVYGDSDACESDVDGVVRLPRTGKKSVSCNFELESIDVYTTIPIEVKLSYKYFLDSTNSIKVLKSLFIGEAPTYSCTAGDHSECCWNNDGPCGYNTGAQCSSDGTCECGSDYEDDFICPQAGQG